jgi:hypothetical protein
MKKIDFGQTVSVLANVGVIAGIVFLAYELRQNNELMSADANMRLLDNRVSYWERLATDNDVAALLLKSANGDTLSPLEEYKLRNLNIAAWIMWGWEFGRYTDGYIELDELPIDGWRANLAEGGGMLDVWENQRDFVDPSPEFVRFIEQEVIGR